MSVREAQPIRWSPAYRNVTVAPVPGLDEALQAMQAIGSSLKCIGADSASIRELEAGLANSSALNAYTCTIGTMQTPSLDAPADAHPIWHGLFRD